ncbi:MAG: 4-hydroxy-tetrahydrodipicolinate synthase [Bacteroidetes bacterium]|nr:4-hydroxy-tetrahydrodipicolinate synthase [Bacteroidota bacterium]
MNVSKLKGTGVALVTPFHKDGSIDFKSFRKLIDRVIDGGVEYLVPLGTTGESVTLTKDEKRAVLDMVVEVNEDRVPIVLGLGGNNTQEILHTMEDTDFTHIDAILSVSPYYNRPSQRDVPARTGSNMDAETTLELAHDIKNIIGIKEASGNIEKAMKIIKNRPKDFLVISGDDTIALPIIACGGDGVISVYANAVPKDFSEMIRFSLEGNFDKARKLQYKHIDMMHAIFVDGNPAGVKGLLSVMNICSEFLRLPLVHVTKPTLNKFEAMLAG